MQRDYMTGVSVACKEGLTAEEVQNLLSYSCNKANTPEEINVLRTLSAGIGAAKLKGLRKQQQATQSQKPVENTLEQSYQYVYK